MQACAWVNENDNFQFTKIPHKYKTSAASDTCAALLRAWSVRCRLNENVNFLSLPLPEILTENGNLKATTFHFRGAGRGLSC